MIGPEFPSQLGYGPLGVPGPTRRHQDHASLTPHAAPMCRRLIVPLTLSVLLASAYGIGAQQIVAHRGASHDAPENTLAAFRLAWEQQADGIEGDFYLTRDRQIVCIHDADTERTAGVPGKVESMTLEQLRTLEAGSWKGARWEGEPIPTFDEVYQTVPDGRLFVIELKSKAEIVPVLGERLRRLDRGRRELLIITFDQATARACRDQIPDVPVQWLTSFKRSGPAGGWRPTAESVAETVRQTGAEGVGMKGDRELVDEAFVATLRQRGCDKFHVWTIDSPDDARFFQRLGAFAITTNRPAEIRAALEKP